MCAYVCVCMCVKVMIPSLLYTIQNNLMFMAMSYISAAVFQMWICSARVYVCMSVCHVHGDELHQCSHVIGLCGWV